MSRIIAIKREDEFFLYRETSLVHDIRSGDFHASGVLIHNGQHSIRNKSFHPDQWAPVQWDTEDALLRDWITAGITLSEKLVRYQNRTDTVPNVVVKTKGQLSEQLLLVWENYRSWQTPEFKKKNRAVLPLEAAADSIREHWPKASAQLVGRHLKSLGLSLDW
jgi:hypothetical protein